MTAVARVMFSVYLGTATAIRRVIFSVYLGTATTVPRVMFSVYPGTVTAVARVMFSVYLFGNMCSSISQTGCLFGLQFFVTYIVLFF